MADRWTPAMESILREKWPFETAAVIARYLGPDMTKNGIIGKARRMGLQQKGLRRSMEIMLPFLVRLSDPEFDKKRQILEKCHVRFTAVMDLSGWTIFLHQPYAEFQKERALT